MADLPHPWDTYDHLQATLSRSQSISHESWGTEAALNAILCSSRDKPLTTDEIARTAASERRRERHRAHLRLVYFSDCDAPLIPKTGFWLGKICTAFGQTFLKRIGSSYAN